MRKPCIICDHYFNPENKDQVICPDCRNDDTISTLDENGKPLPCSHFQNI